MCIMFVTLTAQNSCTSVSDVGRDVACIKVVLPFRRMNASFLKPVDARSSSKQRRVTST